MQSKSKAITETEKIGIEGIRYGDILLYYLATVYYFIGFQHYSRLFPIYFEILDFDRYLPTKNRNFD